MPLGVGNEQGGKRRLSGKGNVRYSGAFCVPGYIAYVLVCVYAVNGAQGFRAGFWQLLVILSVMNLIDRFWVDGYWVGHTNAWEIPGTEDLKPYITAKDKGKKAVRHNWYGGHFGSTGGDHDAFYGKLRR